MNNRNDDPKALGLTAMTALARSLIPLTITAPEGGKNPMTTPAQKLLSHQQEAAQTARIFLSLPNAAILDVESTGLTIEDQAVEIAVIDRQDTILINSLVNPGCPVSPGASRAHGLSQQDIESAPNTAALEPRIRKALTGRFIAAYNAPFAIGTLQYTLRDAGFPNIQQAPKGPLCVMRLFAKWMGEWVPSKQGYRWYTLENALKTAGIKPPRQTGALGHARANLALLKHLASQAQS